AGIGRQSTPNHFPPSGRRESTPARNQRAGPEWRRRSPRAAVGRLALQPSKSFRRSLPQIKRIDKVVLRIGGAYPEAHFDQELVMLAGIGCHAHVQDVDPWLPCNQGFLNEMSFRVRATNSQHNLVYPFYLR